jgi:hypothetical protein
VSKRTVGQNARLVKGEHTIHELESGGREGSTEGTLAERVMD